MPQGSPVWYGAGTGVRADTLESAGPHDAALTAGSGFAGAAAARAAAGGGESTWLIRNLALHRPAGRRQSAASMNMTATLALVAFGVVAAAARG
jgi:hypothetical protein